VSAHIHLVLLLSYKLASKTFSCFKELLLS